MSVATLPSRKRQLRAHSNLTRIVPGNLAEVHCHALTNRLYRSRGLKANEPDLVLAQSQRPSRIESG